MNKIFEFIGKNGAFLSVVFMFSLTFSDFALAQGGLASLDKATNALEDILSWLKVFVVVGSLLYITYLVVMAIAEKKAWSDVMMGLAYCAIAGGVVTAGEWAAGIWA